MPSVLSALEDIATELSAAHARLDAVSVREKPVNVSDESVAATLAQLRGIAEKGSLVERVAWIRSAFDHVEVFDDHAEAHWRETEEPVTSSIDVSSWLRRAGGGRVRRSTGEPTSVASVSWLKRRRRKPATETILACQRCSKRVTKRSPRQ
jgi:hypothetical protein